MRCDWELETAVMRESADIVPAIHKVREPLQPQPQFKDVLVIGELGAFAIQFEHRLLRPGPGVSVPVG